MNDTVMRRRKSESMSTRVTADTVVSGTRGVFRRRRKLILVFLLAFLVFTVWSLLGGGGGGGYLRAATTHRVTWWDRAAVWLGVQRLAHVVVVDAGSTGTRVLAFTFYRNTYDGTLKLDSEFFKETKPGLSSFADSPEKAGDSLDALLAAAAAEHVPAAAVATTPVVLRATAGLRLLPAAAAESLLQTARAALLRSGFAVAPDAVAIMSGRDEGIFSWFTVNFLLDKVFGSAEDTVAVFDLGGGSCQLTFAPTDPATLDQSQPDDIVVVQAVQQPLTLYTKSYLGAGLMAARHMILTEPSSSAAADQINSVCVNPAVSTHWEYAGVGYNISGLGSGTSDESYRRNMAPSGGLPPVPQVNYGACHGHVTSVASQRLAIVAPHQLQQRQIYAISYFFDRAAEAGLVHPLAGGTVSVYELLSATRRVCEAPNADQPLACLDLAYISALLRSAFKLDAETPIHLRKRVDGHETSWALGAAFQTLTNQR